MQGLQVACGLDVGDLWQAAAGFGSGISRMADVCGAVSGGVMGMSVLGARRKGLTRGERVAHREEAYRTGSALYRRFQTEFGAVDCRTLLGFDIGAPDGRENFAARHARENCCNRFVAFAVRTAAELEEAAGSA